MRIKEFAIQGCRIQGYSERVSFNMYEDDRDVIMCEARGTIEITKCPSRYLESKRKRTKKDVVYFDNFGTFPDYRGKGYARKMLQHVKKFYKGKIVYLFVCASPGGSLDDDQLIKFYKSEGFRQYQTNYQWPLMGIEL